MSIKLQFGTEEIWTRALRHVSRLSEFDVWGVDSFTTGSSRFEDSTGESINMSDAAVYWWNVLVTGLFGVVAFF